MSNDEYLSLFKTHDRMETWKLLPTTGASTLSLQDRQLEDWAYRRVSEAEVATFRPQISLSHRSRWLLCMLGQEPWGLNWSAVSFNGSDKLECNTRSKLYPRFQLGVCMTSYWICDLEYPLSCTGGSIEVADGSCRYQLIVCTQDIPFFHVIWACL